MCVDILDKIRYKQKLYKERIKEIKELMRNEKDKDVLIDLGLDLYETESQLRYSYADEAEYYDEIEYNRIERELYEN